MPSTQFNLASERPSPADRPAAAPAPALRPLRPPHLPTSGSRPNSCEPSPARATPSRRRFKRSRSRSFYRAATSSRGPDGTGKTAAFVLPILQILNAARPEPRPPVARPAPPARRNRLPIRCLVLTPTRELALQIEESVRTYGSERPIRSTTIYGGVGFQPQVSALRGGPEIVVATPGRLLDHAGQGTIDLSSVDILVLDEADRMLDMGFIRDIRRILTLLPARRQNLLFSATFSDEIRELAAGLLHDPAYVQIARRNARSNWCARSSTRSIANASASC